MYYPSKRRLGQLINFLRVMKHAGLQINDALQMPITDPEMRRELVNFWNSWRYETNIAHKRAREIMGHNFFGIGEAVRYFGVEPTNMQLSALAELPFTEAELKEVKDTHLLTAVFPLSILEIRDKVDSGLFFYRACHDNESFAKKHGKASWQLVQKTAVKDSTSKGWREQQLLLKKDNEVPTAQVMVYTIIGHYLATGKRLFQKTYVLTSSVDSGRHRVAIIFGSRGLYVSHYWSAKYSPNLGISAVQTPQIL